MAKAVYLIPLLNAVIDCEIEFDDEHSKEYLQKLGILTGKGLRQGMPLSPLLSNFVMAKFDSAAARSKFKIFRYADDLILFGKDRKEVEKGFEFIKEQLSKLGHTVPELSTGKSELVAARKPVEFLGIEIIYKETAGGYVCQVPRSVRKKIVATIFDKYKLGNAMKRYKNFSDVMGAISGTPAAYRNAYSYADNWTAFEAELKSATDSAFERMLHDMFGEESVRQLTADKRKFLGVSISHYE